MNIGDQFLINDSSFDNDFILIFRQTGTSNYCQILTDGMLMEFLKQLTPSSITKNCS